MKQSIRIMKNNVLAIETRKNLFILAQSIGNGSLVFFNCFNENIQQFFNINLTDIKILCCITPVKQFYKKSNIIKINIKPLSNIHDYNKKERLAFELELKPSLKKYVIYKGTEDEIEYQYFYGNLILVNYKHETIKKFDINKDINIIENYQFDTMGMYGELNERLYLSYRNDKYIEPHRDLIIGKEIPKEYKIYYLICSGEIKEKEWLKLPIENKK
ncbi:hypothetical protein FACS189430_05400 [Bacteroidia bacterium]|nr:hypothetical protein FACS189430_05400 [Bacteroidia bacterium]